MHSFHDVSERRRRRQLMTGYRRPILNEADAARLTDATGHLRHAAEVKAETDLLRFDTRAVHGCGPLSTTYRQITASSASVFALLDGDGCSLVHFPSIDK
jgi:hypothetical protein